MVALTTAEKLTAARDAYHKLQTGLLARVFVDQNGERVEFTAANREALYAYIQQLQSEIDSGSSTVVAPRAIGFFF